MTRTDESLGGAVNFARTSSADARLSRAKTAFMISRSRRVRRSVAGFGICDRCRILGATPVACQVWRAGAYPAGAARPHVLPDLHRLRLALVPVRSLLFIQQGESEGEIV